MGPPLKRTGQRKKYLPSDTILESDTIRCLPNYHKLTRRNLLPNTTCMQKKSSPTPGKRKKISQEYHQFKTYLYSKYHKSTSEPPVIKFQFVDKKQFRGTYGKNSNFIGTKRCFVYTFQNNFLSRCERSVIREM